MTAAMRQHHHSYHVKYKISDQTQARADSALRRQGCQSFANAQRIFHRSRFFGTFATAKCGCRACRGMVAATEGVAQRCLSRYCEASTSSAICLYCKCILVYAACSDAGGESENCCDIL